MREAQKDKEQNKRKHTTLFLMKILVFPICQWASSILSFLRRKTV